MNYTEATAEHFRRIRHDPVYRMALMLDDLKAEQEPAWYNEPEEPDEERFTALEKRIRRLETIRENMPVIGEVRYIREKLNTLLDKKKKPKKQGHRLIIK